MGSMRKHRVTSLVWLCCLAACRAPDQPVSNGGPHEPELQRELVRMGLLDQTARLGFTVDAVSDTALMRAILAIDSTLTRRLRVIVQEHGWPTRAMVGEAGAKAAFLVVQHSPSNAFQREMLRHVKAAADAGEASRADAAMLEDRVFTDDGKPQRYGTQFRIVAGELVPYPIEDPTRLDERRAEVGLMPMTEYVTLLERTYAGPVRYPVEDSVAPDTTR